MSVFQSLSFYIMPAIFFVLVLVPSLASSHESVKQASNHKNSKHTVHKLNPQLSFQITLHGLLLWASMGFLMPLGILLIRMSNRVQCGKKLKIFFYFHVILQVSSVLLATAAAILSIENFENSFNNMHQRIGLVLYVLIWVQPLIGFCRPHRGVRGRSIWYFLHWFLGTGASILGIINIFTGLYAYHIKTSRSIRFWVIVLSAEICFIAFLYLLQDRWEYLQKQGVILGEEPVAPSDQVNSPKNNSKDSTLSC